MIKSFSFLKRRPELTHEQFVRHWLDVHVPMSHEVPGVRGYIVSTIAQEQGRSDVPQLAMDGFDGLAQVWFDDLDARGRAAASPQGKRWHGDGASIIGAIRMFVTQEQIVVPIASPRPPLKTVTLIARRADRSPEQFLHEWRDDHAPMAQGVPDLRGFALSRVVEEQFRADIAPFAMEGPLDGLTESWCDSVEARARMIGSGEAKRWFAHGATFLGRVRSYLMKEQVVISPPGA
jgi:uncharacterized protein (TIGR02118 family)